LHKSEHVQNITKLYLPNIFTRARVLCIFKCRRPDFIRTRLPPPLTRIRFLMDDFVFIDIKRMEVEVEEVVGEEKFNILFDIFTEGENIGKDDKDVNDDDNDICGVRSIVLAVVDGKCCEYKRINVRQDVDDKSGKNDF